MKRYLLLLTLFIIAGYLCMAALLSYRYWVTRDLSDSDISISQITKFQENKIESMQPGTIDTVFLGDSSLGNAINAKLFDKLTGTRSLNLALTGSHGHAGALVFLRKITARQPALHNVILFFSVDGMAYGANTGGRFYMTYSPRESSFPLSNQLQLVSTYAEKLTEGREALIYLGKALGGEEKIVLPDTIYSDDYIVSHAQISATSENVRDYRLPNIDAPKNILYLKEIGALCKKSQLHCIYVQGPIMKELVTKNKNADHFFLTVSQKIDESGLTLFNERPFLMTQENRGDSIFHLAHASRDKFTADYAKRIAPLLDLH